MIERALFFLAESLASFLSILFLLRFAMQAARASFYNPIGQFVIKLTNWAVLPLRKLIPGLMGYDIASLLAAWLLQYALLGLKFALLSPAGVVQDPAVMAALLAGYAFLALLRLVIHVLIGALIVQAILSWVNPHAPVAGLLDRLTAPVLSPIRRVLPPISGIDLSPLVAIVLAQLILMFL